MSDVKVGDRVQTVPELGPGTVVSTKKPDRVIVRYDGGEQLEHSVDEVEPISG